MVFSEQALLSAQSYNDLVFLYIFYFNSVELMISIFFCRFLAEKANWDRECGKPLFLSIPLKRWYIVHPEQMRNDTRYLVACLIRLGREMRFEVAEPRM